MTLDSAYLNYPMRRKGMDHDRYTWSSMFERPPLKWKSDRRLAVMVVVSVEWFPIMAKDQPFRAPGHMQTAYPDFRHYTARDYGTRVGLFRLLDALAQHGIPASFATNSSIAMRHAAIVGDLMSAGHEVIAHATDMNATIASGIDPTDHSAIIDRCLDEFGQALGEKPKGWLSIARSQATDTPERLKKAGIEYMLDWVNDDLPYRFDTDAGPLLNIPLNHELSDRQVITIQQQSMDSYVQQLKDACDWLLSEATTYGARILPIHLTPYISGLPYRISALEKLLGELSEKKGVWFSTCRDVAKAFENHLGFSTTDLR